MSRSLDKRFRKRYFAECLSFESFAELDEIMLSGFQCISRQLAIDRDWSMKLSYLPAEKWNFLLESLPEYTHLPHHRPSSLPGCLPSLDYICLSSPLAAWAFLKFMFDSQMVAGVIGIISAAKLLIMVVLALTMATFLSWLLISERLICSQTTGCNRRYLV
jgi:hypothetical protein